MNKDMAGNIANHIFYVSERSNPQYGIFLTIYDKEVIEGDTFLKGESYNYEMNEEELAKKLKTASSIIFYGDKAVKLGIKLKYIHPYAVGEQEGVKTAIFIKTY